MKGLRHSAFDETIHRLVPSRFPPVTLFDWADSVEELEQLAILEGLTNDRLLATYGDVTLIDKEDWIFGQGATAIMAAFTHIGYPSRFTDGSFGIYYAANSIYTAAKETKYHREIFLRASSEPACLLQMREYTARVKEALVDIREKKYSDYLNPDHTKYNKSQLLGKNLKYKKEWGIVYPSVRDSRGICIGIFRPPAITLPQQAAHLDFVWNGECISEIRKSVRID